MNLQQAVSANENPRTNPITAIESLIADEDAAGALLTRLAALQTGNRPPLETALAAPHTRVHRVRFRLTLGVNSPTRKLVVRRIVIALGAMRSTTAVPALLDTLARAPCEAVG